ncbi:50S ribosomal protein L35 [Bacteriovorax sp. DB6_IX]|uniref:50S ribosomal protein L35 n=1 Tax=Bacteriovorax sp. DB6_IX TaxID=1353530 RepID=UPI000389E0D0|nr:50S ribosomal protein L35 [Bacteriovorax sp. DB6_IX]EQC43174.1 ribosomal protein L35 [Bacteriovorax sp. DB6_IX]
MPKMKTRRAAAKRFKAVGNGKFKRKRANLRHILEKKPTDAKKRAGKTDYVNEADVARVRRMLPYAAKM